MKRTKAQGAGGHSLGSRRSTTFNRLRPSRHRPTRPRRRVAAAVASTVMAASLVTTVDALPASAAEPTIFDQPGTYTYTVPAGVDQLAVDALGGAGGNAFDGNGSVGGRGGRVQAILPVNPGDVLTVIVAGDGNSYGDSEGGYGEGYGGYGNRGGGGGGASAVEHRYGARLVVAAGGGGAGAGAYDLIPSFGGCGGNGGGPGIGDGGDGCSGVGLAGGGKGGTATAGGGGGCSGSSAAAYGPNGGDGGGGGGGGGGGYWGGGGGGYGTSILDCSDGGGGGGGGSSYATPDAIGAPVYSIGQSTNSNLFNPLGHGSVILTPGSSVDPVEVVADLQADIQAEADRLRQVLLDAANGVVADASEELDAAVDTVGGVVAGVSEELDAAVDTVGGVVAGVSEDVNAVSDTVDGVVAGVVEDVDAVVDTVSEFSPVAIAPDFVDPSRDCKRLGGQQVVDTTTQGVEVFLYTYQVSTEQVHVCWRAASGGTGVGGKLVISTEVPSAGSVGAPSVDGSASACTTTTSPPNRVPGSHPVSSGGVAGVPYSFDAYTDGGSTAWACVQVGSAVTRRVIVPVSVTGPSGEPVVTWYPDEGTA